MIAFLHHLTQLFLEDIILYNIYVELIRGLLDGKEKEQAR